VVIDGQMRLGEKSKVKIQGANAEANSDAGGKT
jgi:hypothetical protein